MLRKFPLNAPGWGFATPVDVVIEGNVRVSRNKCVNMDAINSEFGVYKLNKV